MLTRNDLQSLAKVRLDDARYLLNANRSSSAYYLAGYAIELGLKACISKQVQSNTLPDKGFIQAVYVHQLDSLVSTAGLRPTITADTKADSQFAAYWAITNNWNVESRYVVWDVITANTLLQAVSDPDHGVFQWVKKHW